MRIKRLEIQGFKSFADRTVLHFGDGITGVVGPNGCGKSNIVDALRWAMGEQSAKHLRGNGMEDVIFAGSESRGPTGMAEVTITFKNDDGTLVPPEYRGLTEISVTRRLFRDGTSEYLINRQLMRLRDVIDLFLGTGVGTKSYSIIEQGRVGLIVTAKPEDRRALIEDAAGISKYKARKKQAERRLEAAEQNLLRVSDIEGELKKRIGSLERQAKKAERYRELKAEQKELELWTAAHRQLELSAVSLFHKRRAEELELAISQNQAGLEEEELAIIEASEALDQRSRSLDGDRQRLAEIEQALAVGAKNVEHLEREQRGLLTRRAEVEAEVARLTVEATEVEAEREHLGVEAAALEERSDGEEIAAEAARVDEAHKKILDEELDLERMKKAAVDVMTAIAQQEAALATAKEALVALEARHREKREETARLEAESAALSVEAAGVRERLGQNRAERQTLENLRLEREEALGEAEREFMDREARRTKRRSELTTKRSRLSSLVEIQKNYEGCQEGVRAVMRQAKETPGFMKELHGLVADVISAPSKFEGAVEAVLGDRLQYVIVSSQDEGMGAIEYLQRTADGRSSFIPLDLREDHTSWAPRRATRRPALGLADTMVPMLAADTMAPVRVGDLELHAVPAVQKDAALESTEPKSISDRPPPPEVQALVDELRKNEAERTRQDAATSQLPVPDAIGEELEDVWPDLAQPGVLGKMVDLIATNAGYEHVSRVLLGDVVVVEDMPAAQRIWRSNGHRKTLVTLSGEVLDPVGILSGGSSRGVSAGLLAKKREIAELELEVQALEAEAKLDDEAHAALAARIEGLESEIRELSSRSHAEELHIVELEQGVKNLESTAARQAELGNLLSEERARIEDAQQQKGLEIERLSAASVTLVERRQEVDRQIAEASARISEHRAEIEAAQLRVTTLKIELAQRTEKREALRRAVERAEARAADLSGRLSRLHANLETSREEEERISRQLGDSTKERGELELEANAKREVVRAEEQDLDQARQTLRASDEAAREKRRRLEAERSSLAEATMKVKEAEIALLSLAETILERYQRTPIEIVPDYHLKAPPTEEDAARLQDLRKKIDAMGEINLTAISEYEEVKTRHDFLHQQKADLVKAIDLLKSAIKKINRTSKDRFVETFALVNEKFETVFPRLFNGGKASLVLTNPEDPLESGIEMLAQPPGKKLQSVSLLSGGEKALTAVALIFGIFLIKPTPFCLLDEVDAPLDDANVGRYNELIRDMSSISQFILITHNKRTMEVPDRLYGVTMEEPGISRLVSVDIKATEQHLMLVS
ncbi:MAG: chromosome segregation protein SMC [Myxococcota bacterium]